MNAMHSRTLALGLGLLVGLVPAAASAEFGDPAGVTGAVQGEVQLQSPARQTSIDQVSSGEDVVMGDGVHTRSQSRLQIMLLDETAITMGENASLVIDEFVYDPDGANSALSASVTQGTFRLVTGGVARSNPDGTKVKLPSAVLTIRGTTTQGDCNTSGCIVALSGAGDRNSAGKKPSQVLVESDNDREVLKRAGFYVFIAPDGTISDPQPIDEGAAKRLAGLFDPLTGGGQYGGLGDYLGGRQLVDASGQSTADAGPFAENLDDIHDDVIPLENIGLDATTNLPTGQLNYFGTVNMTGPGSGGIYGFSYSLDLASRDFAGAVNFNVAGTSIGTINGSFQLLHNPFDQGFSGLHETGAVIDTTQSDTITVNYSIGPAQVDTSVVYTVIPTFGGPVTITGAGPAPIVP